MAVNYFYLIDARHNRHASGIKYQELMVGEAFFFVVEAPTPERKKKFYMN
jgi:hypothetical protein